MRSVMNAQQMREVDKYMIETLHIPGLVLMENAALGTARLIMDRTEPGSVVHVFCGTGNNGGDGLACARILMAHGMDVYVVIVGDPAGYKGDALSNYKMFEYLDERVLKMNRVEDLYGWRVPKAQVIVDAIFGTGLSREVSGVQEDAINTINKSSAMVVSIDMPSGISADNGRVLGTAVRADLTATFQYPKVGQYLYPGRDYTGELSVIPIGVDAGVDEIVKSTVSVCVSDDPDVKIAERRSNTNKGTYGRLFVVAGSRGMAGAAVMCARAGYAAGAGLVTVGAPESITDIVQISAPEATCIPLPEDKGQLYGGSRVAVAQAMYRKTAMAIGPGLGLGEGLKDLITDVVEDDTLCRVVDADALNALDNDLHILAHMKGELVFTPHPAEFARLLGTELSSILEHPLELASAFARKCRVVLVLKGATTIVADKDGSATLIAAGTPGMAKGGSGDVLTGVIAGLAAQGFSAREAAILGTYYCAMAGERAADRLGSYSMTPSDTLAELGTVIEETCSDEAGAWAPEHVPSQIQARSHAAAAAHPAAPLPPRPAERLAPRPTPAPASVPAPKAAPSDVTAPVPTLPVPQETLPHSKAPEAAPEKTAAAVLKERVGRRTPVREETAPVPEPAAVETPQPEPEQPAPAESAKTEPKPKKASAPKRLEPAEAAAPETKPEPEPAKPQKRASHSESRQERRREKRREERAAEEQRASEGERVRAQLHERTIPPAPTPVLADTAPHSRAELARLEADQANEALTAQHRRAAGEPTEAEKEARRQSTAAHAAVDQNTRIAPPVTQPEREAIPKASAVPQDARSEAQRHRDEINAQIQKELKKQEQRDKPVQRTRRRIG